MSWSVSDLMHVLAQLPDDVSLELESTRDEIPRADLLSRAYALEDRVRMRTAPKERTAWRFRGVPATAPEWAIAGSPDVSLPDTMAEMVESLWPTGAAPSSTARADGILRGQRVAIITNLPAHYRVPLFTVLAARLARADCKLRVFFLGAKAPGRPWLSSPADLQFDHEFMTSVQLPVRRLRRPYLPMNLSARIRSFAPTTVVASGFSPFSTAEAVLYARRRRVPFGIWSGEIPSLAARRRPRALRSAQRRWLVRQADFGIAYGSLACSYIRTLQPDLPVVIGRNTSVDNVGDPHTDGNRELVELLAVADLSVPGKGIEVVVGALELIGQLPCRLTVIGGTVEAARLAQEATGDSRIRFLGPLPKKDVLAAYRKSDAFLFPSRADPFGLALAEAMAAELAVVVSRASGAAADLAVPRLNCLLAEAQEPRSWAECITALVEDEGLRRSIARSARETIARRWTIDHAVEGMVAGLRLGTLKARGET